MKLDKIQIVTILLVFISVNSLVHLPIKRNKRTEEIKEQLFFMNQFEIHSGDFQNFLSSIKSKKFIIKYQKKLKEYYNTYLKIKARNQELNEDSHINPFQFTENFITVNISIGTPPQHFDLVVDSGSSNLFVPGLNCKGINGYTCEGLNLYNQSASSTSKNVSNEENVILNTGASTVVAHRTEDTVRIGNVEAKNFIFGQVTEIQFYALGTDGLLGLGPLDLSELKQPSIIKYLYEQGQIEKSEFSVYITKNENAVGSQLILGGVDSTYYTGEINYHPKSYTKFFGSLQYWEVDVSNAFFGNQVFGNRTAVFDTGSPTIYELDRLIDAIQNAEQEFGDNDSLLPDLIYEIGNLNYTLPAKIWNFSRNGYNIGGGEGLVIFGDSFISQYYTVFDITNQRIGFALSKN